MAAISAVASLFVAGCASNSPAPEVNTAPITAPAVAVSGAPAGSPVSAPGTLFDGRTLTGWLPTDFAGRGSVSVSNAQIHLGMGHMTGITWTNPVPRMNYEISFEAMRVDGSDFFCGLTFPVGENPCSFIVGGWGGGVVGLSSIDSEDASQNETTTYMNFANNKWFHIRLRVEPDKIQAWIDDDQVVNLETKDKTFSIRLEMESSRPLGIATWNTAAALKNLRMKKL